MSCVYYHPILYCSHRPDADWDKYIETTDTVITGEGIEDVKDVLSAYGKDMLGSYFFSWLECYAYDIDEYTELNKGKSAY